MITESLANLIKSIKRLTADGRIKWERSSNPSEYLSSTLEPNTIAVYKSDDASTNSPVLAFYVMDEKGSEVFRITASNSDSSDYSLLRELYESVQLKDQTKEEIIESLLQQLNTDTSK